MLLRFKGIYNQVCENFLEGDERELVIYSGIAQMPRKIYQYGVTQSLRLLSLRINIRLPYNMLLFPSG